MVGGLLFLVGMVGLIGSIIFFVLEFRRGTRFFVRIRTHADRLILRAYRVFVFGDIPHAYRVILMRNIRKCIQSVVHAIVLLLRSIERPLVRMSRRMTHAPYGEKKNNEQRPSPFLRDIIDHKKENGQKPDNQV